MAYEETVIKIEKKKKFTAFSVILEFSQMNSSIFEVFENKIFRFFCKRYDYSTVCVGIDEMQT